MRVDVLVGLAAVTMIVLAPGEDPAPALAAPAEPPPVAGPPPVEEHAEPTVPAVDWDVVPGEAVVVIAPPPTTTAPAAAPAPAPTTTTEPPPPPTEPPPTTTSTEAPTTTAAPATTEPPATTAAPATTEPPTTTTEAPEPEPEPAAVAAEPTLGGRWADLRDCESGGDYGAVSPGGAYRGAYQFARGTWDGVVARMGRPDLVGADPAGAAPGDQDDAAAQLYSEGGAQPWPQCGRYL